MYVICMDDCSFWQDYPRRHEQRIDGPWTRDVDKAVQWSDKAIPEQIIVNWTMTQGKDERGKSLVKDGQPVMVRCDPAILGGRPAARFDKISKEWTDLVRVINLAEV